VFHQALFNNCLFKLELPMHRRYAYLLLVITVALAIGYLFPNGT
jgi:hypothetical protein